MGFKVQIKIVGGGQASFLVLFTIVNLTGSIWEITLKTDAIHKEDYPSMIGFVLSHAKKGDAVCGFEDQIKYYAPRLSLKTQASYYSDVSKIPQNEIRRFDRIWLLGVLNMHTNVSERIIQENKAMMQKLNFVIIGEPKRFGARKDLPLFIFLRSIKNSRLARDDNLAKIASLRSQ